MFRRALVEVAVRRMPQNVSPLSRGFELTCGAGLTCFPVQWAMLGVDTAPVNGLDSPALIVRKSSRKFAHRTRPYSKKAVFYEKAQFSNEAQFVTA